jgi:hypothetical protein
VKRGWLPELARDRRIEAVGIAIVAFGCLLTGLTWAGVREATNVAYQLPIIASGGILAVGCFIVGGLLLVGGIVMTRFARLEARRTGLVVPRPGTGEGEGDGDGGVELPEGTVERREAVRSRRRVFAGRAGDS